MSFFSFLADQIYLGLTYLQSLLEEDPPVDKKKVYPSSLFDNSLPYFSCPNCGNGRVDLLYPQRWVEYLQCDCCSATFFRIDRRVYHYIIADETLKPSLIIPSFNHLRLQLTEFSMDLKLSKLSPSKDPDSKEALLDLYIEDKAVFTGLRLLDCAAFLESYQKFLLSF